MMASFSLVPASSLARCVTASSEKTDRPASLRAQAIEESSIVDNLINGIQTNSAGSVVNVGASTIGGNGTGVKASSGSLISFGNNQMSANGSDGNFTSTTALR